MMPKAGGSWTVFVGLALLQPTSILRARGRASYDLGIHRKLSVIGPLDLLVLSEPLDQADATAARQDKTLREPEFGIHLGLFEDHSGTGIEARQEQAPRYGIGGLGLHSGPLVRGFVDPHPATQFQQHSGIAAFRFCAGPRRAGDHPDTPPL